MASIEKLNRMIEGELERVRAQSPHHPEIIKLEELQFKILRLWKQSVDEARRSARREDRTRWIKRNSAPSKN